MIRRPVYTTITGPAVAALSIALLSSGCAVQSTKDASRDYYGAVARSGQFQTAVRQPQQAASVVVSETTPRFTKQSIPLQRASTLPAHIGNVSMRYPGRHSLATVAELISRLIDIPVIMTPDALAGAQAYAPGAEAGPAPVTAPATDLPFAQGRPSPGDAERTAMQVAASVGAKGMSLAPEELRNTMELNYSGSLAGLLDQVATRAELQWEYLGGKITFSRVVTRAIALKSLPNGLSVKGQLDVMGSQGGGGSEGSGGGSGGGGSSGAGSLAVSFDVASDYWAELPQTLKSMLSPKAFLKADPKSGIVTVTDALSNVERVEAYLRAFNTQLLRQVVLELEVLQVNFTDEYSNGINWSAVLNGTDGSSLSLVVPPGKGPLTAGSAPGTFTFQSGSDATSKLVASALQEYGRVSTTYSSVVTTTNRMPVPVGAMSSVSYVRQTVPGSVSSTGGITSGGITPGTVSTGFSMVLTPVILDSNRILLQSAMNISSLRQIKEFSSGTGVLQQSVQLPEVAQFATLQRASVQAGQTLVLVGYENEQTQVDDTDIVRGVLPVSRRGGRTKTGTVILITPRLADL